MAENGPGVQTYDSKAMYDDRGQARVDARRERSGLPRIRRDDQLSRPSYGTPIRLVPDSSNSAFPYAAYGYGSQIAGTYTAAGISSRP